MRGRGSATIVPAVTGRRERMRGRLGTGTEGVCGRGHGRGMLPARRNWQRNWFPVRRSANLLGQPRLEGERPGRAGEVDRRGDRPEQKGPVLEEEAARGRADDPTDLPRDARRRDVAADELWRCEIDAERCVDRSVQALADR